MFLVSIVITSVVSWINLIFIGRQNLGDDGRGFVHTYIGGFSLFSQ